MMAGQEDIGDLQRLIRLIERRRAQIIDATGEAFDRRATGRRSRRWVSFRSTERRPLRTAWSTPSHRVSRLNGGFAE